jgi:Catalytic LigB subunit of aromatic ring-opening dioxygenase
MGEIIGIGVTHYPALAQVDEHMADALKHTIKDPGMPEAYRSPESWPAEMREEWGKDEGTAAAARHRAVMVNEFRKMRQELDRFKPDFIVIWGDDQYENFKEDIIPPFSVLAYDRIEARPPWSEKYFRGANAWNEPADKKFIYRGHPTGARYLATALLEDGVDVSYAYRPLHHPLGHAFLNALLFLDYDRVGFEHSVVPFQVNCYGRRVVSQKAGLPDLAHPPKPEDIDPPSPTPKRCFEVGAATARALAKSPWRVALMASSSWSHAFLTQKNHWIYPDREADRYLYEALAAGDYKKWHDYPLAKVEESGQQEVLNWSALIGAMKELNRPKPDETAFTQTWIFNSSKAFAVWRP